MSLASLISRRPFSWLFAGLIAVLLGVVSAGCSSSDEASGAIGERKLRITTTTNFITDMVREVGGERVEVTGLMGPGVDPHLYKASAADVRALRDADVIFFGGLQLEGKMDDLLRQLGESQTTKAGRSGCT
jgi:manganese/zinc/iron transport system substrate-binding protein